MCFSASSTAFLSFWSLVGSTLELLHRVQNHLIQGVTWSYLGGSERNKKDDEISCSWDEKYEYGSRLGFCVLSCRYWPMLPSSITRLIWKTSFVYFFCFFFYIFLLFSLPFSSILPFLRLYTVPFYKQEATSVRHRWIVNTWVNKRLVDYSSVDTRSRIQGGKDESVVATRPARACWRQQALHACGKRLR
jgi:hypothetical protein